MLFWKRTKKIALLGEINGSVMPKPVPVELLDLSHGGFSVASSVPFRPNAEYTFQFNASRQSEPIRARDTHCLRVSDGKRARYLASFSFVSYLAADWQVVEEMLR